MRRDTEKFKVCGAFRLALASSRAKTLARRRTEQEEDEQEGKDEGKEENLLKVKRCSQCASSSVANKKKK